MDSERKRKTKERYLRGVIKNPDAGWLRKPVLENESVCWCTVVMTVTKYPTSEILRHNIETFYILYSMVFPTVVKFATDWRIYSDEPDSLFIDNIYRDDMLNVIMCVGEAFRYGRTICTKVLYRIHPEWCISQLYRRHTPLSTIAMFGWLLETLYSERNSKIKNEFARRVIKKSCFHDDMVHTKIYKSLFFGKDKIEMEQNKFYKTVVKYCEQRRVDWVEWMAANISVLFPRKYCCRGYGMKMERLCKFSELFPELAVAIRVIIDIYTKHHNTHPRITN